MITKIILKTERQSDTKFTDNVKTKCLIRMPYICSVSHDKKKKEDKKKKTI